MRLPTAILDKRVSSDPLRRRLRRLFPAERREEASLFLDLYHRENGLSETALRRRKRDVLAELRSCGWYEHRPEEIAFGARVAWRNSASCIGRLFWRSLEVFDCRAAADSDELAAHLFEQMRVARADGRVRSTISIFRPVRGDELSTYVESSQLVQFAGYIQDGRTIGDPKNLDLTRVAMSLGWRPPEVRSDFDVLPVIIREPDGRRTAYQTPEDAYRLINICHPSRAGLTALGLKWYDVPFVSDMILTVGGIDYPCAPFNGHYMATEIACRNLVDEYRYNRLQQVGEALELDLRDPYWKDEALTELNRAVLHSFKAAGVSICDHHTASDWYAAFVQNEHAEARFPSGDWAWIVPPHGGAVTPPFHMSMKDLGDVPNFYRARATDGERLGVSRATELQHWNVARLRQLRRRYRRWVRARMQ